MCPGQQHCEAGRCVANCPCIACTGESVCSATTGRCGAAGCDALTCGEGSTRDCTGALPRCVFPCGGVTCPFGSRCAPTTGRCVADLCANVTCPSDSECNAGQCVRVARMDAGVTDAGIADARVMDAPADGANVDAVAAADAGAVDPGLLVDGGDPNCACRTPRGSSAHLGSRWWLALALLAVRRRRAGAAERRW
jgi:hypothetical protein